MALDQSMGEQPPRLRVLSGPGVPPSPGTHHGCSPRCMLPARVLHLLHSVTISTFLQVPMNVASSKSQS